MVGRILIADEDSSHRIWLNSSLAGAGYCVEAVSDAQALTDRARATAPDVILLPERLAKRSGNVLCAKLRALPETRNAALALIADNATRAGRLSAIESGFDAILRHAPAPRLLRAWVRNLLRRQAAEAELQNALAPAAPLGFAEASDQSMAPPGQICIIANSLSEGLLWRNNLTARMRDRISVLDPQRALQELGNGQSADAIVISHSAEDPDRSAQLVSELRSRSETLRAAIVLVQEEPDQESTISALDFGVNDVLEDGFEAIELSQVLRREMARKARDDDRRASLESGLRMATFDSLTGLHNRRSALTLLDRITEAAERTKEQFAVMVLDLDRFKSINDRFGHRAGDAVLSEVSQRMQNCLRQGDVMARIGGEEFLAVVQSCDAATARVAAERLRRVVADSSVKLGEDGPEISVTISIGMVLGGSGGSEGSAAELIDLADRGLYAAKSEGRNQVTIYQSAA
ncbi:diguanylate cyclase [Candidatus Rhodobacter oscarellae]|nr:diguanylate cyclase [Candidatus Rhodobacter lobularis]